MEGGVCAGMWMEGVVCVGCKGRDGQVGVKGGRGECVGCEVWERE